MVFPICVNVIMVRLTCANTFGTKNVYQVAADEDCNSNRLGGPFRNAVHAVRLPLSSTLKVKDSVTGYIACIVDDAARDMGWTPISNGYTFHTVFTGREYCKDRGYSYFALQNN